MHPIRCISIPTTAPRAIHFTPQHHRSKHTILPRSLPIDAVDIPALTVQLISSTVAAYIAAAWPGRPRGSSRQDLIEVKSSPIQGRGVFAKCDIQKGTVLGSYPGRLRNATEMIAKTAAANNTIDYSLYCFQTKSGMFLDPTDASTGLPSQSPTPGLPWLPIDVTLSFVNEPPKNSPGVNICVEDDVSDPENGLVFVACEDIVAGSELFIDYGLNYDRSQYKL